MLLKNSDLNLWSYSIHISGKWYTEVQNDMSVEKSLMNQIPDVDQVKAAMRENNQGWPFYFAYSDWDNPVDRTPLTYLHYPINQVTWKTVFFSIEISRWGVDGKWRFKTSAFKILSLRCLIDFVGEGKSMSYKSFSGRVQNHKYSRKIGFNSHSI